MFEKDMEKEQMYDYDTPDSYYNGQAPPPIGGYADKEHGEAIRDERIANVIAQINPEQLVDEIEHRLKGQRKDFSTGGWVKINPNKEKIISMKLLEETLQYLSSLLTQHTTLSRLNSIQINNIMKSIIKYIVDWLADYDDEYNFDDNYIEKTRIAHMIVAPVFFALCRAENGVEAQRMWKSLNVNENLNQQPVQKKSFIDSLKFWQ